MPEELQEDKITIDRKRLIFRSWHRGTREIDILLGRFADEHIPSFDANHVRQYERLLKNSDPDLYNWMTEKEPVPPSENTDVMKLLLNFLK